MNNQRHVSNKPQILYFIINLEIDTEISDVRQKYNLVLQKLCP